MIVAAILAGCGGAGKQAENGTPTEPATAADATTAGIGTVATTGRETATEAETLVPTGPETSATATESVPAPEPLSAADYQARLDKATERLLKVLDRARAARTYAGLLGSVERAAQVAGAVEAGLGDAAPPVDAAQAHEELAAAVGALAAGLERTAAAVRSRSLCAASALDQRLGQLEARDRVQAAVKDLRALGYAVPALLPKKQPETDRGLPNGTYLVASDRSGRGELAIENGRVVDAVVALVPASGRKPALAVYVPARSSFTATGVPDGSFRILFTYGQDWDPDAKRFTRKCDFGRFDDELRFTTESTGATTRYSIWQISLQPKVGGTATTSPVEPDAFPGL